MHRSSWSISYIRPITYSHISSCQHHRSNNTVIRFDLLASNTTDVHPSEFVAAVTFSSSRWCCTQRAFSLCKHWVQHAYGWTDRRWWTRSFCSRVSNLPATHPSRILFDTTSTAVSVFNNGLRYPFLSSLGAKYYSVQRKYQTCYNRCSFDENGRIVKVSTHLPLNERVLPPLHHMSLTVFESLQRYHLLHSLHRHHGAGNKSIFINDYDLINTSLPAYMKYDYSRNHEIAWFRCRLRLNRGRTNQYMQCVDDSIPPHCRHRGPHQLDTTSHIFLHCPQFSAQRRECYFGFSIDWFASIFIFGAWSCRHISCSGWSEGASLHSWVLGESLWWERILIMNHCHFRRRLSYLFVLLLLLLSMFFAVVLA